MKVIKIHINEEKLKIISPSDLAIKAKENLRLLAKEWGVV